MSAEALHRRLSELGARPKRVATAETAVRTGRLLRCPVVLPRGLARVYAGPDEEVSTAPVPGRFTLFLVTRRPTPSALAAMVGELADRLGLERPAVGVLSGQDLAASLLENRWNSAVVPRYRAAEPDRLVEDVPLYTL
ncbi:hypothetical protein [Micromonospora fulviviridis]|uniref:Uncharacterized protein n=1 Tax=Micromonospora fulviviridis TaxID=47860 RepID=A0ABV2VSJ4_9ACTN